MTKLYAVYGTLKKNHNNHHILRNSKFIGTTHTKAEYNFFAVGSAFPAVTLNGNKSIPIEIYKVDDPSIERDLDRLEGFVDHYSKNNFYDKILIDTEFGKCNMYVFSEETQKTFYHLTPINSW